MRKETFEGIVQLVGPQMQRQDTQLRSAIPIQKRVAIAVWRLAIGDSYRAIGTVFGVGKSTAIEIALEFCRVLEGLAPNFIAFPQTKESVNCRVPQAVGAIDGTHTEIIAQSEVNKFDYFDRNKRYSIILQGIVGANLKFLDIEVGYPGAMHDCRVLRNSEIFTRAENREILSEPTRNVRSVEVRPLLLGDGAYLNLPWLIKPYPHNGPLTASQTNYNRKLSAARSAVERGYGLLKARWRVLLKRLDNKFHNAETITVACCVLVTQLLPKLRRFVR